mmetsp:Transcript_68776/g.178623  ORF Transcript_68776/g.178623 Transcript_68776/m.178623 type:complete len:208 (+) Transcript_68776:238-861(+)
MPRCSARHCCRARASRHTLQLRRALPSNLQELMLVASWAAIGQSRCAPPASPVTFIPWGRHSAALALASPALLPSRALRSRASQVAQATSIALPVMPQGAFVATSMPLASMALILAMACSAVAQQVRQNCQRCRLACLWNASALVPAPGRSLQRFPVARCWRRQRSMCLEGPPPQRLAISQPLSTRSDHLQKPALSPLGAILVRRRD